MESQDIFKTPDEKIAKIGIDGFRSTISGRTRAANSGRSSDNSGAFKTPSGGNGLLFASPSSREDFNSDDRSPPQGSRGSLGKERKSIVDRFR
jgi:hypothetical protein